MDFPPQSEIEKQREAWWAEHFKLDMTFTETARLNEQAFTLFPITEQERRKKTERLKNIPEFVL